MLLRENYTKEHIVALREQTGADPSILERTVFAFGLLEAIRSVGMPFIFKGGTSLLVLLDHPRRLSTDIDIIVDKDTDVDDYASEVMYLAASLLTGQQEYVRIEEPDEYRDIQLKMKGIKKVNGIRNTNPTAYAYMVKSFMMLQGAGLYTDSII